LNKRNKSNHKIKGEKERENLGIDWLDELDIYNFESQIHQNNANLPSLFLSNGVFEAKS